MANRPTVPGHEAPLPDDLVGSARALILKARSAQTRHVYRGAWTRFEAWCRSHGRRPLPASVDTIAGWMTSLAQDGKAPTSINTYLSAVIAAQRTAGFVIDRNAQLLADLWRGIANEGVRVPRQARPITAPVLRDLLAGLDPSRAGDARDGALLALGWAAALRRSELIGLDWQEQGNGSGFVGLNERGLSLTLIRSKSSQATPVTIAVPRRDMPDACLAVQTWMALAALEPGSQSGIERTAPAGTVRRSCKRHVAHASEQLFAVVNDRRQRLVLSSHLRPAAGQAPRLIRDGDRRKPEVRRSGPQRSAAAAISW